MNSNTSSLYVGNLDKEMTTEMLFAFFAEYRILSINHPYDQITKRNKPFAFIQFADPHQAKKCLLEKNYNRIMRKPIRLMPVIQMSEIKKDANVFIKNIDKSLTSLDLLKIFKEMGEVVVLDLRTNDQG